MTVIEGEWYNNIKSYGEKNRIDKNRTYIEQPKEASYLEYFSITKHCSCGIEAYNELTI